MGLAFRRSTVKRLQQKLQSFFVIVAKSAFKLKMGFYAIYGYCLDLRVPDHGNKIFEVRTLNLKVQTIKIGKSFAILKKDSGYQKNCMMRDYLVM